MGHMQILPERHPMCSDYPGLIGILYVFLLASPYVMCSASETNGPVQAGLASYVCQSRVEYPEHLVYIKQAQDNANGF